MKDFDKLHSFFIEIIKRKYTNKCNVIIEQYGLHSRYEIMVSEAIKCGFMKTELIKSEAIGKETHISERFILTDEAITYIEYLLL